MSKNHIKETDYLVMWKQSSGEWIPNFVEGRIYSTKTDKYLKTQIDRWRYEVLHVRTASGAKRTIYLHRALWVMRYGIPYDPKLEVDHINCDPQDNRLCNLRLVTHGENKRNSKRFAVAEAIRAEKAAGATTADLAKKYDYTPRMIRYILSNYSYDPAKYPGTARTTHLHYSNPRSDEGMLRWKP